METRYIKANQWPPHLPLVTRHEATRAASALWRRFATADRNSHGRPPMENGRFMSHETVRARNPWVTRIASKSQTVHGGWRRLVHDMSHSVHGWANPRSRPHDPRHEGIESEMVAYVLASGWLDGKLRPKAVPVPSATERAAVKHGRDLASLARWQSKAKRAAKAIAKLQRAVRSHERRAT